MPLISLSDIPYNAWASVPSSQIKIDTGSPVSVAVPKDVVPVGVKKSVFGTGAAR